MFVRLLTEQNKTVFVKLEHKLRLQAFLTDGVLKPGAWGTARRLELAVQGWCRPSLAPGPTEAKLNGRAIFCQD